MNDTPAGAVKQFLVSFATQDTAALARLLSADYRFSSAEPRFVHRFPKGLDRAGQIDSVARLPAAPPNRDPESFCVRSLLVFAGFPDTIVAHSLAPPVWASQTIALRSLLIRAQSHSAEFLVADSAACSFLLVRGDSARVPPGERPDAERWYVARWHSGAAPDRAGSASDFGREASPKTAEAELAFGVRRESALHSWPVTFALTLPDAIDARAEVFDPAGRRVMSHTVANPAPAVRRFRLEEGDLATGLYWLRVSHGRRWQVTKFVVLR